MKKAIGILALILLILFIAYNPNDAATIFEGIGGVLWSIVKGFGTFFVAIAKWLKTLG